MSSNMHRVSAVAKEGLNEYAEQLKSHFVEATFASAEIKATMEIALPPRVVSS
ncbi:hypothetical protein LguiA_025607 [Lonicera macranthoides]